MTAPDVQNEAQEVKKDDKELNFRKLEQRYQKQLEEERRARMEAERAVEDARRRPAVVEEEDDDNEPYVDHKKLEKKLAKFGEKAKQDTQTEIQRAVQTALSEERRQNWLKNNSDFYDVLQHADKFAAKDPELAETILTMPDNFDRQKLVYKNIKALGLHQPEQKPSSIQDKIDANRRSPSYQPSGMSPAAYASQADFSPAGQKNAYAKMKELKGRLGLS